MTGPGAGWRTRFRAVGKPAGKPSGRPLRGPRRSETLHTEILAAMSDTVLITDDTGRFTYICPNVGEVLGRSARQVLGLKRIDALFDPRALEALKLGPENRQRSVELELTTPSGGRRTVRVQVRSVSIDGGTRLYACRDITEQKRSQARTEDIARAMSADLTHAARLALTGALAASIAHEMTQPLTAIVANASAALGVVRGPEADELRRVLDDIVAEGRRAADVVQRLRTLCRKQPLNLQVLDLNEIAREALQLAGSDASRRRVTLNAELAPALPRIRGDRVCLQQVLLNLLVNAMDAMQHVRSSERQLALITVPVEHGVSLTVADAGHGMPPDTLARMFEAFFTTKTQGMGLGLSISRSIVEAHHGRIWAENRLPTGAAFHVVLPAAGKSGFSGPRLESSPTPP